MYVTGAVAPSELGQRLKAGSLSQRLMAHGSWQIYAPNGLAAAVVGFDNSPLALQQELALAAT